MDFMPGQTAALKDITGKMTQMKVGGQMEYERYSNKIPKCDSHLTDR